MVSPEERKQACRGNICAAVVSLRRMHGTECHATGVVRFTSSCTFGNLGLCRDRELSGLPSRQDRTYSHI